MKTIRKTKSMVWKLGLNPRIYIIENNLMLPIVWWSWQSHRKLLYIKSNTPNNRWHPINETDVKSYTKSKSKWDKSGTRLSLPGWTRYGNITVSRDFVLLTVVTLYVTFRVVQTNVTQLVRSVHRFGSVTSRFDEKDIPW